VHSDPEEAALLFAKWRSSSSVIVFTIRWNELSIHLTGKVANVVGSQVLFHFTGEGKATINLAHCHVQFAASEHAPAQSKEAAIRNFESMLYVSFKSDHRDIILYEKKNEI
jgi:hypothetical protein